MLLQGLPCTDTQWLLHPATLGRRPEEQRRKPHHQPNLQLPAQVGCFILLGQTSIPHLQISALSDLIEFALVGFILQG